jgi:hypothetical protein
MRLSKAIIYLVLTELLLLSTISLYGQADEPNNKKDLIGIWGMFKDRHPDGWGSWNPPYEYLKFKEDSSYVRIYLAKKGNALIFGYYEIVNDSIKFYDNVATDGFTKAKFASSTSKLHSLGDSVMELWEDWDRILSKRIKKCGHKKKYRQLTKDEEKTLEAVTTKLTSDYLLIKDRDDNN